MAIAAQREDLELLHLLSTSPETPPMSDDEDEDSPMAREAEIRRRRSTTEQAPSGLANEAARPNVRFQNVAEKALLKAADVMWGEELGYPKKTQRLCLDAADAR